MKTLTYLLVLVILAGCSANAENEGISEIKLQITEPFTQIMLSENIELHFTQSDSLHVKMLTKPELTHLAEIKIEKGVLIIEGEKTPHRPNEPMKLIVEVAAPSLQKLTVKRNAVFSANSLHCENGLEVFVTERGKLHIRDLQVNNGMTFEISDRSSSFIENLLANECDVNCYKSCSLNVENIHSDDFTIASSSNSDVILKGMVNYFTIKHSSINLDIKGLTYNVMLFESDFIETEQYYVSKE